MARETPSGHFVLRLRGNSTGIRGALHKSPNRFYESGIQFGQDLRRVLAEEGRRTANRGQRPGEVNGRADHLDLARRRVPNGADDAERPRLRAIERVGDSL